MDMERRYFTVEDLEIRAGEEGESFVAEGHAATFDQPYDVFDFREQVDPSAFDSQLDNPNVMALWNHNADNVLGSVGSGTLELSTDDDGLMTRTVFPDSAVREREAIERGDVRKMSFGFRTLKDEWEVLDDGTELRTILDVELFDVSPVAFPANPSTDVSVAQRSRQEWHEECEKENGPDWKTAHAHRRRRLDLAEHDATA